MRKVAKLARITRVEVECPKGHLTSFAFDQFAFDQSRSGTWSASEQECDLCGSHGEITFRFECPRCSKGHDRHTVILDSW